jgi:hypothetical protein
MPILFDGFGEAYNQSRPFGSFGWDITPES